MATLSCSALFPAFVPVIEALGGISPESVASVTDFVTDYASQLDDVLISNAGVSAYISACRQRQAAHQRESAPWDELLQVALDSFMLPPARRMRDWVPDRRSRQVTSILRGLRRDVQAYLHGLLLAAEAAAVILPQGAPDSVTPHPAQQPTNEAMSSHAPPHYNGDASHSADCPGGPATLPATRHDDPSSSSHRVHTDPSISAPSDRERIYFAYSLRDDRLRRVAAGRLVHLHVRGNKGRVLEQYPSVAMLRDVAPRLGSLKTDLPFLSELPIEQHSSQPRLFPALETLAIDMLIKGTWHERSLATTLAGLQADLIQDVRLINAPTAVRTCIIIHDWYTRDIVYTDGRGFRRSVSGDFVNAIPFVFDAVFFDGITDLTLTEMMPEQEVKLLFACFPRALERLQLLFGGFASSFEDRQCHVLTWRGSGRGCCAHLRRITLTGKSPLEDPERPPLHRFSHEVKYGHVYDFLDHIHDNTFYERSANGTSPRIFAEGGVTLLPC